MDGIVIIAALAAVAIFAAAAKSDGTAGMSDTPVSAENVRKGVSRGWYKAALTRVNGQPAIYLYGKDTNGLEYGDKFPISETEWQQLKSEGFDYVEKVNDTVE